MSHQMAPVDIKLSGYNLWTSAKIGAGHGWTMGPGGEWGDYEVASCGVLLTANPKLFDWSVVDVAIAMYWFGLLMECRKKRQE
jgi:hypothetical protein